MERSLNALRFPLVALAMIVVAGCGKAPEATQSAMPPPAVSVAQVIKHQVTEWDELTGRLEAPESVEIRPRVSGFIDRVAFHEIATAAIQAQLEAARLDLGFRPPSMGVWGAR